ncbi:MAG: DUF2520 domain-containing protein [Ignavibacteriaceae bacterium]|nr:DUF2520 domain-containing protein [Ignavibacteriaceae bacterium]
MIDIKSEITFIGAGKAASSIIKSFCKSKLNVTTIISRNIKSAKKIASAYSLKNYSDRIEDIPKTSKIIFLTVPDDKIAETAEQIVSNRFSFKDKLFVHISGTHNSSLLSALQAKEAITASFHIMFTFPSRLPVNFRGCYAAVETDSEKARKILFQLAETIGLKPFELKKDEKVFYHISGVAASNFLSGILFSAEKSAINANISTQDYYALLEPIILGTLKNIKKNGAAASVSGPIDRGDLQTIISHLKVLKKKSTPKTRYANILLLNYIANSLTLLEAVEEKYGSLTGEHKKIKSLLIKSLNELSSGL